MQTPKIFILGATGNTGRLIARYLLQETGAGLVVASRSLEKAQAAAASLNQVFSADRAHACQADAADPASLTKAFEGMDWIVVASSTARYAANVALAALDAGAHYLDVQYASSKHRRPALARA
jgi:saccharopine dehydrogenase-like NADP-dependent oxidoreductase